MIQDSNELPAQQVHCQGLAARVAFMTTEISGKLKHCDDGETWQAPPRMPACFQLKVDLAGLPRPQSVNLPPDTWLPPVYQTAP